MCIRDSGNVGGDTYNEIIGTVSEIFNFNILRLLPVVVVIVLIVMKKPTIPTFVAGAAVAILVAMITQGASLTECITIMYSGYAGESGSEIVDSMLNRGGMSSICLLYTSIPDILPALCLHQSFL